MVSYYLLSSNAYVQAVGASCEPPRELHLLRPDRMKVIARRRGVPQGCGYTVDDRKTTLPVDSITRASRMLHFKHFNPLSDLAGGLAPIEAPAYSIDQHNQAGV